MHESLEFRRSQVQVESNKLRSLNSKNDLQLLDSR